MEKLRTFTVLRQSEKPEKEVEKSYACVYNRKETVKIEALHRLIRQNEWILKDKRTIRKEKRCV